jgi:hypothetical protein
MDSIKIETGEKRIAIEDENGKPDPDRVIVFNPSDVLFAERFEGMKRKALDKVREFEAQAIALEKASADTTDETINAENDKKVNVLRRELCTYMRGILPERHHPVYSGGA